MHYDVPALLLLCIDSVTMRSLAYYPVCSGNWWYNCESYGLSDIPQWLQFGVHGFPVPLATEHAGKCVYSPERKLCPVPPTCAGADAGASTHVNASAGLTAGAASVLRDIPKDRSALCDEMPRIHRLPVGWGG